MHIWFLFSIYVVITSPFLNERFVTLLQLLLKSSKKVEELKSTIILNHLSKKIYHKNVAFATKNKNITKILQKYYENINRR